VNYLVVRFLFRHRRLDQLLEGEPTVLIADGQLVWMAGQVRWLVRVAKAMVEVPEGTIRVRGSEATQKVAKRAHWFEILMSFSI
jgi:hypothetical protein